MNKESFMKYQGVTGEAMASRLAWVMGLGAISLMGTETDEITELTGSLLIHKGELTPTLRNRQDQFLKFMASDISRTELLKRFEELISPLDGDGLQFNSDMLRCIHSEVVRKSSHDVIKETRGIQSNLYFKTLYRYTEVWTRNSFRAFNLANAVALLRCMGTREMLSEDEIIEGLMAISERASDLFSSYEVFGEQVAIVADCLGTSPYFQGRRSIETLWSKNQLSLAHYRVWNK